MKKTLDLSFEDWLILKMELGARSTVLDATEATDKAEALRRVLLEIARSEERTHPAKDPNWER